MVARSTEGMTIGTPVETVLDGRDTMLCVGMNGEPLPLEHGFPVRMLTPGLYGYAGACKWLTEIELTTFADFDAYWVRRGWAARGPVKTASRIDKPQPFAQLSAGPVTVAGVAWAQGRGISAVEVRVDDGAWAQAELLPVPVGRHLGPVALRLDGRRRARTPCGYAPPTAPAPCRPRSAPPRSRTAPPDGTPSRSRSVRARSFDQGGAVALQLLRARSMFSGVGSRPSATARSSGSQGCSAPVRITGSSPGCRNSGLSESGATAGDERGHRHVVLHGVGHLLRLLQWWLVLLGHVSSTVDVSCS